MDSAASPSSLPSSVSHNWEYRVFPSFCEEEISRGFFGYFKKEFERKGIKLFIDRRESFGPGLIEAIRRSRIAIVILSKHYASSTLRLDELVEIMKCREELGAADVKKQSGYFGSVFEKACVGRSVEDVEKWKRALNELSFIFGYLSGNWKSEDDMMEEVANNLSNMLNKAAPSTDFDGFVGTENHITQISSLLSLDFVDDVRMVGIWGPAGIGKTTVARALYWKLSNNFEVTDFMESIRGSPENHHPFVLNLQEQYRKVLLVLDDVHDSKQLKAMAGNPQWFGRGSRIIITTNDKKLLKAHGIDQIYHVEFPSTLEALEIFCLYAFDQKSPYDGFEELSMEITGLAGNLPLGLSVFGSYLRGMSKGEWMHALPRLRTSLDANTEKALRCDYETLCDKEKALFLHMACFFKGERTSNLGEYFSNLDIRRGLQVLAEKSLISIDNGARLVMHNLLELLGLEISRKEYIDENRRRAREIGDVLADDTGYVSARGTDHVLTAIKDEISIDERANERTLDSLPALSPLPSNCTHHVFASFRGVDVRKSFLRHMLMVLRNKGITLFTDIEIETGTSIAHELKEAIHRSRISIILISNKSVEDVEKWKRALDEVSNIFRYVSRSWEMEEIIEKVANNLSDLLYEDVPSGDFDGLVGMENHIMQISSLLSLDSDDVRMVGIWGPSGIGKTTTARALYRKLSSNFTHTAFMESIKAIREEIHTDDHAYMLKNEAEMIENVATDISNKLNMATASRDFDGLVGMENHITQISSMLSLDSNDVRMVGILGPAGIGKTTIARALYNKLSNSFTHTAFMESIRGSGERTHSDDYAFMLHLQEQFLSKTFNHKDLKIHHLGVAEERLKDKKVLLVLDDVVDLKQLKAMAGNSQWFGCGSRIIMTTKAARLLEAHGIDHIYHVGLPSLAQAYEIFCLYAFGQKFPYDGYEDLAMEVTGLAGDLPLGLRVFGSHLRGMSKEEWIEALPRLRTSLDGDIEKVLRFSYEALCDKDKDLFLHIACLFEGESISYLEKCLAHSDLDVRHGLKVLANNSLISITEEERLVMHNLVEQLGKEIVRQEHKDEPERRKFLVDAREICDVLTDNTGSKSVLGIDLDIMAIKDELCIDKRAFEGMTRLQFLRFKSPYGSGKNNKLILPQGLNNLPRKLRLLCWDEFPLRCLPPDFAAEFLVILEMRNSSIEKLWEGSPLMDMSYSLKLKDIPNVSNATNLETLILNGCESLVEIPTWFKNLSRLTHLKMVGCKKLKDLPTNINMESLYHLDLSHCTQLKTFPEISTRIGYLDLENTGIEEVPSSIRSWPDFAKLSMRGCKSLRMFPDVLDSMEELN
uniref:TIR domain-containing protein n=2 Tax=Brassica campestris TaxID=3711 RepID=M4FEN8_BRACM